MPLPIRVIVEDIDETGEPYILREYTINHDDIGHRRVLGQQCRYAFEAGQSVSTFPESHANKFA